MSKILYFSSGWCNPCKQLAPTMEKSGLPYQKVDVDMTRNYQQSMELEIFQHQ